MSNEYPLVWVHLGPMTIPKYLKTSFKYHASIFPDKSLILLVDNESNLINFGISNLKVHKISIQDEKWESLKRNLGHDLSFRNEFWFTSLARFKGLYEYMTMTNNDKILHIESDVMVLPNFPFESFCGLDSKLGYLLQGHGQGIASLFYVSSRDLLHEFLDFCASQVVENPQSTDMTILFNFASKYRNKVSFLPTLTEGDISEFIEDSGFTGVFDAISVGQYLFGIDPRNSRGRRIVFKEDKSHFVKPSKYRFEWRGSSLMGIRENLITEIYSLHIHSKDKRVFSLSGLQKHLVKRNEESLQGETVEIIFNELLKSIWRALLRRIRWDWSW